MTSFFSTGRDAPLRQLKKLGHDVEYVAERQFHCVKCDYFFTINWNNEIELENYSRSYYSPSHRRNVQTENAKIPCKELIIKNIIE